MGNPNVNIGRLLFYSGLAFFAMCGPVYAWGGSGLFKSFVLGYVVGVGNIVFSLLSIQCGFRKKAKTFYGLLYGGMIIRLFLVACIVFLLIRVLRWPVLGFVISFMFFYLFLQYHEIRMLTGPLNKRKNETK